MQMSTKKKVAAIVITTVALTAGTIGVSSASSKSSVTRVSTTRTVAGVTMMQGRGAEVASVLAALVTKGTITQAQSDAITAALTAADAAKPAQPLNADKEARLTLISTTIGVDAATIKTRLAAGETLAAIAGAKKDALIAALVAEETKRIDAAVTAGKLTAAQATTLKSTLTAHVTTEVNSVRPMGPKGGEKGERGRSGPKGGPMGSPTLTLPATPKA
jgi:polyhydroxyalkanoate synthesis regulator phasin